MTAPHPEPAASADQDHLQGLLQAVLDNLPAVVAVLDRDGRYVLVNTQLAHFAGRPPHACIGHTAGDLFGEAYGRVEREREQAALAKGAPSGFYDETFVGPDGRTSYWMANKVPLKGPSGAPEWVMTVGLDVTTARLAQEAIARRDAMLEIVSFGASDFLRGQAWRDRADDFLTRLGGAAEVSRSYIFEFDDAGGDLVERLSFEWSAPSVRPVKGEPGSGPMRMHSKGLARWAEAYRRGEIIQGAVGLMHEAERAHLEAQGIRSVISAPIHVGDELWGNIGFDQCDRVRTWTQAESEALRAAAGVIGALILRERAEAMGRASEGRFRSLFESAPIPMYEEDWSDVLRTLEAWGWTDPETAASGLRATPARLEELCGRLHCLNVNRAALASYRFERAELFIADYNRLRGYLNTEGTREHFINAVRAFLTGKDTVENEIWDRNGVGDPLYVRIAASIAHAARADWSCVLTGMVDLTEQKRAEDDLRKSREMLRVVIDSVPASIFARDSLGRYTFANRVEADFLGAPPDGVVGRSVEELRPGGLVATWREGDAQVLRTGQPIEATIEAPATHSADGRLHYWLSRKEPLRDATGKVTQVLTVSMDVTAQHEAEERLRAAQKMEAVGQLTGGLAHDFNNLLTVVLGNADLLAMTLADNPEAAGMARMIQAAAERGARLTQHLLAFARRQTLQPVTVNPAELIEGMDVLLRRTIGEATALEVRVPPGLWLTRVDPGQLEMALLNLAINARDAMPEGGRLTVAASNASMPRSENGGTGERPAGDYVRLDVTDTGAGMTSEVRERAFEPFFTTKEVGKGTGLGLSMVYGFVKQSGGHIEIETAPGKGTTVTMLLPRERKAEEERRAPEPGPVAASQNENVVLVEDDPFVRSSLTSLLASLGYEVTAFETGVALLEALPGLPPFDALITDVVLPGGKDGATVAREVVARTGLRRVLLISGYPRDAPIANEDDDVTLRYLQKPFRKSDLARELRSILDADPRGRRP